MRAYDTPNYSFLITGTATCARCAPPLRRRARARIGHASGRHRVALEPDWVGSRADRAGALRGRAGVLRDGTSARARVWEDAEA